MNERDYNKERLALVLEAAGLDLWENNLVTGEVSKKALRTLQELGYNEQEVSAYINDLYLLIHPDDQSMVKTAVAEHLSGQTAQYRCEFRLRSQNGDWIWYANYGRVMDGDSENPGQRFIGVTFNINDRKSKEDEIASINRQLAEQNTLLENLNATLELLAASDSLTGLANRRHLMAQGLAEYKRAARFEHPLSLLMVDIDLFKHINDTWGHPVGDQVICTVADLCRHGTRKGLDIVARFGGEEFVIVLPETNHASACILAEWLRQTVAEQTIVINSTSAPLRCTVSIGIATWPHNQGTSFEQLLSHADQALYQAKQAGRNQVQGFQPMVPGEKNRPTHAAQCSSYPAN